MADPKRPIKFNVQGAKTGRMKSDGGTLKPQVNKPKAGNRSAQAYIDSLNPPTTK